MIKFQIKKMQERYAQAPENENDTHSVGEKLN
jgi:hypothetical protein